ncbi:MAG: M48 family metalloprotease [Candidatus Aminicenantales bacterium]
MRALQKIAPVSITFFVVVLLASCAAVQQGADILAGAGQISESDRQAIQKTSQAVSATFSEITEEQEYYIGRSVAALILAQYPAYDNPALTTYINTLGQAIVYSSDRPEIYAGYHFLILDTEEVNALSAPGGFIFISKGLVRRCHNEEMLASILAHEVGHVCAKHGLQAIKKSRLVDAFRVIGQEAARRYGPEELAELTTAFEGALGDVVETLVVRGYDRKYEYEADGLAVKFDVAVGYSPKGLTDFLQTMVDDSSAAAGKGWFKTHPSAEQRIEKVKTQLNALSAVPEEAQVRTERFEQSMTALK